MSDPGKGLLITLAIILFLLIPFGIWFVLRAVFIGEAIMVDLKSSPFEAIRASFKMTKNRLRNVFIIIIVPIILGEICFDLTLKSFGSNPSIAVFMGEWICHALLCAFISCASLRLYLVLGEAKEPSLS